MNIGMDEGKNVGRKGCRKVVLALQHRSIETLCRDIQTYEVIKLNLDQVPTCPTFLKLKNLEVVRKVIKAKNKEIDGVLVTLQLKSSSQLCTSWPLAR